MTGRRLLDVVRVAAWMGPARAGAYIRILFVFMALGAGFEWLSTPLGHHPWGKPMGPPGKPEATDFLSFWVAGRQVLAGHPALAYDLKTLSGLEHQTAVMDQKALLAFFYPPSFLLLCLPFAALPYLLGFAAFVGVSLSALAVGLRRILTRGADWGGAEWGGAEWGGAEWGGGWLGGYLPVLAFPGLLINAVTGQNGFWSASCFAWALLWLERRPGLAGAALGALVIKPHLALVVPVALLAARRWRALVSCGAVALAWLAVSWMVLGTGAWRGFFDAAPAIRDALENHREDWGKLQSLFATLRILSEGWGPGWGPGWVPGWGPGGGAGLGAAYAAQAVLAVAVTAVLAMLAWRRPGAGVEVAAMAAAAMLCTPHILDYDLAVTGVPLAWIAAQAMRSGWLDWEKLLAGLAFLWPLVARALTSSGMAPVAPLVLLGLFWLVVRRGRLGPAGVAA